jgi:hypothetical protein
MATTPMEQLEQDSLSYKISSLVGKTVTSTGTGPLGPTITLGNVTISAVQFFDMKLEPPMLLEDDAREAANVANASPDPYWNDTEIP